MVLGVFCLFWGMYSTGGEVEINELFALLVQEGQIAGLCESRSTLNMDMPTAGGRVCWDTVECGGWKLQRNIIFGNWRILDPGDVRRAWGTAEKQLEDFLNDRPVSALCNYFDCGGRFARYIHDDGSGKGTVVLLHGIGVRAVSMGEMAEMLYAEGYDVLNYDYSSSRNSIAGHSIDFLAALRREEISGRIFFVTHSMGGLVLRHALAGMDAEECGNIGGAVMLGTPNQGSGWAYFGRIQPVINMNRALQDMIPGSQALDIPFPPVPVPVGVIAGKFDGKVACRRTLIKGMECEYLEVNCTHPGLRDPANTGGYILNFLATGTFTEDEKCQEQ